MTSSLFLLAAAAFAGAEAVTCPPAGFNSLQGFNTTEYITGRWYIQQQQAVSYLPKEDNFCVYADYKKLEEDLLQVHNYANVDKVNGKTKETDTLRAYIKDLKQPSKLLVGPKFLPHLLYGDYWVLAAGPSPAKYDWAIVSGGPPTHESGDACACGSGINGAGLWLFTRAQVAKQAEIDEMLRTTTGLGFDTSVLGVVNQTGCLYK